MSTERETRHILHVGPDSDSGEWQAWCCCGWASYTWRRQESARTAAETHAASISALPAVLREPEQ